MHPWGVSLCSLWNRISSHPREGASSRNVIHNRVISVEEGTSGTLSRIPYSTTTREGPTPAHKTTTSIAISSGRHDLHLDLKLVDSQRWGNLSSFHRCYETSQMIQSATGFPPRRPHRCIHAVAEKKPPHSLRLQHLCSHTLNGIQPLAFSQQAPSRQSGLEFCVARPVSTHR